MPPARQARIAAFAALLASAGDLLLLYVANSQREELGLPPPPRAWLGLGAVLGVIAIPVYAIGYGAASRLMAVASARAARLVFRAGAAAALVGAVIHGLTAWYIDAEPLSASPGQDPLTSVASWGAPLLALWALAALLVATASVPFLWLVGRGATPAPRAAALANPAFLTVALAAAGLPFALSRSFLTPAAPNLAHLIFFLACSRLLRSGYEHDPRAAR